MTGYGRSRLDTPAGSVEVEARSVNNRFLKVQLRLGRELLPHESELEELVRRQAGRGTVSLSVRLRDESLPAGMRVDVEAARRMAQSAAALAGELGIEPFTRVSELIAAPGVMVSSETAEEIPPALLDLVKQAIRQALDALTEMRSREGQTLAEELRQIASRVRAATETIRERSPVVVLEYKEKLKKRLDLLLGEGTRGVALDDVALLREVAILADRTDVAEELQRLGSHLDQLDRLLGEEQIGKKLEFLLQEMLREANTIASKAADAAIAHRVVEVKADLERLREQAQNVE